MDLNSFINIQKQVVPGTKPSEAPTVDRSEQTSVALDMAKRAAEKAKEEPKPVVIPPAGAMPIPN